MMKASYSDWWNRDALRSHLVALQYARAGYPEAELALRIRLRQLGEAGEPVTREETRWAEAVWDRLILEE